LAGEIEFMNQYIHLMKLRIPDKITVRTDFKSPEGEYEIAPLLFISLIENAFKHGVSATQSSELFFKFKFHDNTVTFIAENPNYPKNETDKSGSGIGLNNLKKRLDLLYPGKYRFETNIEGLKFRTTLSVTIK
jgi:LytS/YehU family sensor histidine kinase